LEKTNAKIRAKMVWANAVSTHCDFIKIHLRVKLELLQIFYWHLKNFHIYIVETNHFNQL